MENQIMGYFDLDGRYTRLEIINDEPLYVYGGDIVFFDLDYMIEEHEQGFVLILIDREHSFAYADGVFKNKAKIEARLSDIRETLEKMSILDKQLSMRKGE